MSPPLRQAEVKPCAPPTRDLVFRIPARQRQILHALSAHTRISYSKYLREALADLLEKYADRLNRPTHWSDL